MNSINCVPRGRILVVEDQDDVRRMLVTALEIEGHTVDEANSAPAGLKRLRETRYNLVLSDYAMPGGTGTWMLREAARLGLLETSVALIITAHPDVRELADVEVISKPLDLDFFLDQVRRLLTSGSEEARPLERMRHDRWASSPMVELVLYVSSESAASLEARNNVERLLAQVDGAQVQLLVKDLSSEPLAGEIDCIMFTPTLVKTYPEPKMWLVGNLRDPQVLLDLLRVCGIEAATLL